MKVSGGMLYHVVRTIWSHSTIELTDGSIVIYLLVTKVANRDRGYRKNIFFAIKERGYGHEKYAVHRGKRYVVRVGKKLKSYAHKSMQFYMNMILVYLLLYICWFFSCHVS